MLASVQINVTVMDVSHGYCNTAGKATVLQWATNDYFIFTHDFYNLSFPEMAILHNTHTKMYAASN